MKYVVLILGLFLAAPASAFEYGAPSRTYARGSVSILAGMELTTVPSGLRLHTNGAVFNYSAGLDAVARIVVPSGFTVQPHLGFSTFNTGSTLNLVIVPGVGLGYAAPIAARAALTPMARLEGRITNAAGFELLYLLAELPVAIFLGEHGYIEPYVNAGAAIVFARTLAGTTVSDTGFVFGIGYRLGVKF